MTKDELIRKHIEEATEMLEKVEPESIQLMYGPPEDMFSRRELAEMRLHDEVLQDVEQADLTADQWKDLVAELVADEHVDFRLIKVLLEERTKES